MKIKKQIDTYDCGISVIQALYKKINGKNLSQNILKKEAKYGHNGLSLNSFIELGNKFNIELNPFEVNFNDLLVSDVKNYFVALINNDQSGHYIIAKVRLNFIEVHDPIIGKQKYSFEEFEKIFSKYICLINFEKKDKQKRKFKDFRSIVYLPFHNLGVLSFIVLSIFASIVINFSSTIFMKIIMDKVIPGHLHNTLILLTISFVFLNLLRVLNTFIKNFLVKKINIRIENQLLEKYLQKLHFANSEEIMKISKNDHIRRFSIIPNISLFISNSIFIFFYDLISLIISFSLLLWVSSLLFAVTFIFIGIILFFTILFKLILKNDYDEIISLQYKNLVNTMDILKTIENMNHPFHFNFYNNVFKNSNKKVKYKDFSIWIKTSMQKIINEFLFLVLPIFITFFATNEIFENKLSLGSMMMFLSLIQSFVSPIISISEFSLNISENLKYIKMLEYVYEMNNQERNINGLDIDSIKNIELFDFSYEYGTKEIFNIKKLIIDKSIHIIGKNGIGKTTFMKCLFLNKNSTGEYKINGIDKSFYKLDFIKKKMLYIESNAYLPSTSILEAIISGDVENKKIFLENIKKFQLDKLLISSFTNLNLMIENNGENLSSGQKQLINLMKIFAGKYDVIFLDEALENIDLEKFLFFKNAVKDLNSIFIEVSHSSKFLKESEVINFEKIIKNK